MLLATPPKSARPEMRALLATLWFVVSVNAAPDLILRNGLIYDGTGRAPFKGDIAIANGRIIAVGNVARAGSSRNVIDANGFAIAPGFIDVHTHAENIIYHPKAENFLRMGVTTLVLGNCGSSKLNLGDFYTKLEQNGFSPNIASLIGHGTVRGQVMGGSLRRPPNTTELGAMQKHIDQAMRDGALGMSTGLIYLPGVFARTDELVALSKTVAAHGGIYVSHMRSEGTNIFNAIDEVCTIAEQAKLPAHISHLKLAGRPMWGKHPQLLARLDKARTEGIRLTHDQYAYTASSTSLHQLLPDALIVGGAKAFSERIKGTKTHRETVEWMKDRLRRRQREDYSYAVIAYHKKDKRFNGLNVKEAAKLRYGKDDLDHQISLIFEVETNGGASAVFHGMHEDDARAFLRHSHTMFASDSSVRAFKVGVPHPRGYGNAARFLARYTRDQKQLKIEEAIRKLTSLPAHTFQLKGRGELRPGFAADLVVFDPAKIQDNATFKAPHQYATGFRLVLVNGKAVVENDRHNAAGPGQVIRRGK
jgi:N-acyl-D-amino-acid deacylase